MINGDKNLNSLHLISCGFLQGLYLMLKLNNTSVRGRCLSILRIGLGWVSWKMKSVLLSLISHQLWKIFTRISRISLMCFQTDRVTKGLINTLKSRTKWISILKFERLWKSLRLKSNRIQFILGSGILKVSLPIMLCTPACISLSKTRS